MIFPSKHVPLHDWTDEETGHTTRLTWYDLLPVGVEDGCIAFGNVVYVKEGHGPVRAFFLRLKLWPFSMEWHTHKGGRVWSSAFGYQELEGG